MGARRLHRRAGAAPPSLPPGCASAIRFAVNTSLVLTLLGSDRPGLVETVAKVVHAHDGNWLESRMARLANKFAGLLLVSVPEGRAEALIAALGELRSSGLSIVVERADATPNDASRTCWRLDLEGQDRPGIVSQVSRILAGLGVSVDELSTAWRDAPMAGGTLFTARAELHLPANVSGADVQKALEAIAQDLMVEIAIAGEPSPS
jgi:glycine cleavage system regulatory protein